MIAVGWLDIRAVNFISTADSTKVKSIQQLIQNDKLQIPAPEVVCQYNKFRGGVDKNDRLRSTFVLASTAT